MRSSKILSRHSIKPEYQEYLSRHSIKPEYQEHLSRHSIKHEYLKYLGVMKEMTGERKTLPNETNNTDVYAYRHVKTSEL